MTGSSFTPELKDRAAQIGFAATGVCRAVQPPGVDRFRKWLAEGYAGQMHYLPDRREAVSAGLSLMVEQLELVVHAVRPTGVARNLDGREIDGAGLLRRVHGEARLEVRDPRVVARDPGARDRFSEAEPLRAGELWL